MKTPRPLRLSPHVRLVAARITPAVIEEYRSVRAGLHVFPYEARDDAFQRIVTLRSN